MAHEGYNVKWILWRLQNFNRFTNTTIHKFWSLNVLCVGIEPILIHVHSAAHRPWPQGCFWWGSKESNLSSKPPTLFHRQWFYRPSAGKTPNNDLCIGQIIHGKWVWANSHKHSVPTSVDMECCFLLVIYISIWIRTKFSHVASGCPTVRRPNITGFKLFPNSCAGTRRQPAFLSRANYLFNWLRNYFPPLTNMANVWFWSEENWPGYLTFSMYRLYMGKYKLVAANSSSHIIIRSETQGIEPWYQPYKFMACRPIHL